MNRCKSCGRLIGIKEHKCVPAWNKGLKGCYTLSEDTKKKIGLAGIGKKHSNETKEKIRIANIGNTNNLGKHHSQETRIKIGESNKGRVNPPSAIESMREKLTGRRMSLEQRARRSGELSANWKGGVSRLNWRVRQLSEYINWRKQVFYRDNFTCVLCGKKGNVEADHIKSFALLLREFNIKEPTDAIKCVGLWDTDNGRTLCKKCHKETPNHGHKSWLSTP